MHTHAQTVTVETGLADQESPYGINQGTSLIDFKYLSATVRNTAVSILTENMGEDFLKH